LGELGVKIIRLFTEEEKRVGNGQKIVVGFNNGGRSKFKYGRSG